MPEIYTQDTDETTAQSEPVDRGAGSGYARGMILTLIRALAWFGAFIVFWSLNVRWGTDINVGNGPPGQWERHVVGAGLLALVAALALSVSGRRGKPPSWTARGIALGAGVLIIAIALLLRSRALSGFEDLIAGAGWTWMLSGGGFVLAAATLAMALKPADAARADHANRGGEGASGVDESAAKETSSGSKTASMQKGAGRSKKKRRKR